MSLAAESIRPEARERPWASGATDPDSDSEEGCWADFTAWRRWLTDQEDGQVADAFDAIVDAINDDQETFLYLLMCDLADGKFAAGKA